MNRIIILIGLLSIGCSDKTFYTTESKCHDREVDAIGLVTICNSLRILYQKNTSIDLTNIKCDIVENKKIIKSLTYHQALNYAVNLGKGIEE